MGKKIMPANRESCLSQERLVIDVFRYPEIKEFSAEFRNKPEIKQKGKTSDEAIDMLLIAASSIGLSGMRDKYTIVTRYFAWWV